MKKFFLIVIALLVAGGLGYASYFAYKNFRGAKPAFTKPEQNIVDIIEQSKQSNGGGEGINNTEFPLQLPEGFSLDIFAKDLPGARVLAMDDFGNFLVSRTKEGIVTQLIVENGVVAEQHDIFRDLNNPHGLAFDPEQPNLLYIAEENKISKVPLYSEASLEKIVDLPEGSGYRNHFTRTISFGPDGRLYVSIGSSCDVCREETKQRAVILSMNKDGSDIKTIAQGLRNTVFFDWNPVNGKLWGADMGRDGLGDDLPPDEINIIEQENTSGSLSIKDYGWPICYGKQIHDSDFDKNQYIRNPCQDTIPAHIELPAHVAPLGIAFVPEEGWPEEMWYNLLVAEHGSWNRKEPVGYKIVRLKLDAFGNYEGSEDFIAGWLTKENSALGRPVDLLIQPGGILYISDDHAGVIYRVSYGHDTSIGTFNDCAAAGYPIMESYPRQCREPGGRLFVERIDTTLVNDVIVVATPAADTTIGNPLTVEGKARGTWYFEASFSVEILDANNHSLGVGVMQAKSDWMTEEFVPFLGTFGYEQPTTDTGWLVLKKANPSDLPEYDAALRIPIRFSVVQDPATSGEPRTTGGCVVTGCSQELCADQEQMSTCEYKEEYICYQKAFCERNESDLCAWRNTPQITACIGQYRE